MKNKKLISILAILIVGIFTALRLFAAEQKTIPGKYEYVTIRWGGKENTHIIRPGGEVEFIGYELKKAHKPERADDRAYYMNVVMNGLVKEGFEFAGMNTDEIVMKRPIAGGIH
jgi:hypothetical protein